MKKALLLLTAFLLVGCSHVAVDDSATEDTTNTPMIEETMKEEGTADKAVPMEETTEADTATE